MDQNRSVTGRDWRLNLVAILALGLVIGGIAYRYSDDVIELAKSITGGHTGKAQPRVHY